MRPAELEAIAKGIVPPVKKFVAERDAALQEQINSLRAELTNVRTRLAALEADQPVKGAKSRTKPRSAA